MPNAPHILLAALAVLLCAGAPAKPAYRSLEWDGTKDADPNSYTREGLTVTVASRPQTEDGVVPIVLTIASPRFGRTTFTSTNSAVRQAAVLVAPLDPKADGPVVALQVFTGGAHCCTQIDILEQIDGAWKHVDAGQWDGDFGLNAVDFDGDGVPDIELHDDAFDYAFACYACGSPPPRIFDLEGGVWTDVSAAPRFAPVFRAAAVEMKKGCGPADGGGQNGLCATYVAEAARAGDFPHAWAYMLSRYDREDAWDWPTGCRGARTADHSCPKSEEVKFKTYPDALKNFLVQGGYVTAAEAAPAPTKPH